MILKVYWRERRDVYRIAEEGRKPPKGWKEASGFMAKRWKKTVEVLRRRHLRLNPNEDPKEKVKEWEKQTGRKVVKWEVEE